MEPLRPSWGEPYSAVASPVWAVVDEQRFRDPGRVTVLVTHQVPIWVARRRAHGQHLFQGPGRRRCALASITSLRFAGDRLVGTDYREPVVAAPVD